MKKKTIIIIVSFAFLILINFSFGKIKSMYPGFFESLENVSLSDIYKQSLDILKNQNTFKDKYKYLDGDELLKQVKNNESFNTVSNNKAIYVFLTDASGKTIQKEDGYFDARIIIKMNDSIYYLDNDGQIEVRGNTTAKSKKKPYNIRFSSSIDIPNLDSGKKWCLLSESFDPTMLRNSLFLELAEKMELPYTSKSEFVELWIDGDYRGAYLLTEPVEAGESKIDIKTDDNNFLFEYERTRDDGESFYVETENGLRFVIKDPKLPTEKQLDSYINIINKFDSILFSNDYELVKNNIDVDGFAKYFLLNEFSKTTDFKFSSVKFYYTNSKFYAGPVWDFDLSSGNASLIEADHKQYWNLDDTDLEIPYSSCTGYWCYRNRVFKQLLKYDEFKQLVTSYFVQYSELLNNAFVDGGILDQLLKQNELLINKNYSKDSGKWDVSYQYGYLSYPPLETYEENYEYLKKWLSGRYEWLSLNQLWTNE